MSNFSALISCFSMGLSDNFENVMNLNEEIQTHILANLNLFNIDVLK